MNKDAIRLWVNALRSGEYRQAIGALAQKRRGEWGYCCLGVACEVSIRDGLKLPVSEIKGSGLYGRDSECSYLPGEVLEWLGIESTGPVITDQTVWVSGAVLTRVRPKFWDTEPSKHISVARLNDAYGFTFEEIALALELEYLS